MQDTCNSQGNYEIVVKQENLDEHVQIKCEAIDEDEIGSYENVQIKEEFEPPNENQTQEINCEMPIDKETIDRFSTENCSKVNEITNIYDDNIEIKYENDIVNDQNDCDEDSIDSKSAEALHNVEACLQDEIKVKLENETHEVFIYIFRMIFYINNKK